MRDFPSSFFTNNRQHLAGNVAGHFLVLAGHSLLQSAADLAFPFRQDSSFWYLTGLEDPDLILTIDGDSGESTLYLPEQNDYQKEWDGAFNKKLLKQSSGISNVKAKDELLPAVEQAVKKGQKIGYLPPLPARVEPYGFYANPARQNLQDLLCKDGPCKEEELVDVRKDVARLRQVKQPVELKAIQAAIDTTGLALAEVKKKLHSYKNEKEIERALTAAFYAHGADGHAFQPIIASGKNAATIHYEKNNDELRDGLLLMDVGANVQGYAADISRTWAFGTVNDRQKEVWQACQAIQEKGISLIKPGAKIRDIQKTLEAETEKQLKKLGTSMPFERFPHGFSHFLGLDPHDAGVYDEPLVPGSVITMEPGIYLPDEGIGVRIEDDVLVIEDGNKVLSEQIPKVL